MILALKTLWVGCQTSNKGSWSAGKVERLRKWKKMVVKNNSFLNSYFRQKKWLEICYVKKQDLV